MFAFWVELIEIINEVADMISETSDFWTTLRIKRIPSPLFIQTLTQILKKVYQTHRKISIHKICAQLISTKLSNCFRAIGKYFRSLQIFQRKSREESDKKRILESAFPMRV